MIASLNYKTWMLIIMFAILAITASISYAVFSGSLNEDLYVDNNGYLIIEGHKKWERSIFKKIGYTFYKDYHVYESEGILSKKTSDYDEAIVANEKAVLYFEIRDNVIYRGVLVSEQIPVIAGSEAHHFRVGMKLSNLVSALGEYEMLSGDGPGTYFKFRQVKKISFYTECSFYPEELTEKQKRMTRDELFSECEIDSILFFGNEGQTWE